MGGGKRSKHKNLYKKEKKEPPKNLFGLGETEWTSTQRSVVNRPSSSIQDENIRASNSPAQPYQAESDFQQTSNEIAAGASTSVVNYATKAASDSRDNSYKKETTKEEIRSSNQYVAPQSKTENRYVGNNDPKDQFWRSDKNTNKNQNVNFSIQRINQSDTIDGKYVRDEEYDKFDKLCKNKMLKDLNKIKEKFGDLFEASKDHSLAHCVAEDLNMGSGIAIRFKSEFKNLSDLYNQRVKQGGLAVLEHEGRFIYYLVTKRISSGKPTYETLWKSLYKMKSHIIENKVEKLALPKIGCGLDRLEWKIVKSMLEYLFQNVDISIVVWDFQQNDPDSLESGPKKFELRKSKQFNQKYSLIKIESYTMVLYFGTEDGKNNSLIKKLDTKYRMMSDYERGQKTVGKVIRTQKLNDIIYGCIVKKNNEDQFDFVQFEKCLKEIKKFNKQDHYSFIAIEAFMDEDDDLLLEKIINIIRSTLYEVDLYVCWPEELQDAVTLSPYTY